jgi:hypothetical protein
MTDKGLRRFPPPWRVEQTPGGFTGVDASGQALVYVYARETPNEANIAGVLTFDEARLIAVNVAKLPESCGRCGRGAGLAFLPRWQAIRSVPTKRSESGRMPETVLIS